MKIITRIGHEAIVMQNIENDGPKATRLQPTNSANAISAYEAAGAAKLNSVEVNQTLKPKAQSKSTVSIFFFLSLIFNFTTLIYCCGFSGLS